MPESSPAACRFAIRDRTAFCFLLGGLLKIDSALTLISFAGRDTVCGPFRDADDLFFAIVILHAICVDDQQHRPLRGSNSVPPLVAIHDAILVEDYVGIVENQRRALKRDATVLPLVDPVLFAVPLKPHRYTICITLIPGESTVAASSARRSFRNLEAGSFGCGEPVQILQEW